jgi:hypothetical protein
LIIIDAGKGIIFGPLIKMLSYLIWCETYACVEGFRGKGICFSEQNNEGKH